MHGRGKGRRRPDATCRAIPRRHAAIRIRRSSPRRNTVSIGKTMRSGTQRQSEGTAQFGTSVSAQRERGLHAETWTDGILVVTPLGVEPECALRLTGRGRWYLIYQKS